MTANSAQPQRPSSPPQIIALYGGKGGAGKTTCTYNLGLALVQAGKSVLFVDWDGGQASLSALAGVDVIRLKYGLYEAIQDSVLAGIPNPQSQRPAFQEMLGRVVACVKWLGPERKAAILANNLQLASLESELTDVPNREFVLKQFLGLLSKRFDFVLIDCPANRGLLSINALTAANWLILPIEASGLGFQATGTMLSHPKFLPRITGRNWTEEMVRLGLNAEKWHELAPISTYRERRGVQVQTASQIQDNGGRQSQSEGTGAAGAGEFLDALMDEAAAQQSEEPLVRYPNPALRIVSVIPTRYNPEMADARHTLASLVGIFGPAPQRGDPSDPMRFVEVEGPGLLTPPIPYSGSYQRGLGMRLAEKDDEKRFQPAQAAHELNRRHKPVWDYIAQDLINKAERSNKYQQQQQQQNERG